MANIMRWQSGENEIREILRKLFQSANINFLIGSGASSPAIAVLGNIEQEIEKLFREDKETEANKKIYDYLNSIQAPTNDLINKSENEANSTVSDSYKGFLKIIERVLVERKSNLLPKQATVFTTNYDLFFERASEDFSALRFNDGFSRSPSLGERFPFASENLFNSTFNHGTLYNYRVELPCLNLIKLHGSLSWKKSEEGILFEVSQKDELPQDADDEQIVSWNNDFAVVVPQKGKFRETLLDRVYYDLLRIYANELDKENTMLVCFGFSFADEHIFDITKRALKNPTLRLIIFAFQKSEAEGLKAKFELHNNVTIVAPNDGEAIAFCEFNSIIDVLQEKQEAAE